MTYNDFDDEIFFLQSLSPEEIREMDLIIPGRKDEYKIGKVNLAASEDDDFSVEFPPENKSNENTNADVDAKTTKKKNKVEINSIHKNHRQRVKDKFLKYGLESFTAFEVLEMLLFYSIPYKDTNVIAHRLIDRFGSLKGVIDADYHDLIEVSGINYNSASLILLYRELSKYIQVNSGDEKYLSTSKIAGDFCCKYFYHHVEENMILISLDSNKRIKCIDVISKGTESETAYYPRKIMKAIVKNRANGVILAHNHPGSSLEPSANDILITGKLTCLLSDVSVTLVDHVICSGSKFTSMSDKGMIKD